MSGLSRTPGKRVQGNTLTRVRIPPSPPEALPKHSEKVRQTKQPRGFRAFFIPGHSSTFLLNPTVFGGTTVSSRQVYRNAPQRQTPNRHRNSQRQAQRQALQARGPSPLPLRKTIRPCDPANLPKGLCVTIMSPATEGASPGLRGRIREAIGRNARATGKSASYSLGKI